MEDINVKSINKSVVNKLQERDHALNGWIGCSAANTIPSGNYSGIKALAGDDLIVTLTLAAESTCNLNSITFTIVPGDFIPIPGLTGVTVTQGSCLVMKAQQ
jgi:hypothetical protein